MQYARQTRTRSFVLAHMNEWILKGGSKLPHPPNRLIFCTNVQDDALNLCYARQTRTRSFVLAHTNEWILKGGSKLPPTPESSDFLHKCSGWCTKPMLCKADAYSFVCASTYLPPCSIACHALVQHSRFGRPPVPLYGWSDAINPMPKPTVLVRLC